MSTPPGKAGRGGGVRCCGKQVDGRVGQYLKWMRGLFWRRLEIRRGLIYARIGGRRADGRCDGRSLHGYGVGGLERSVTRRGDTCRHRPRQLRWLHRLELSVLSCGRCSDAFTVSRGT